MVSSYICVFVILAAQLGLLRAQPEINCPPGQFFTQQSCEPCPAGTFRSVDTPNTCVPCPAGTFSPVAGLGVRSLCRFCPRNTFSDAGSARCANCPEGTVADTGSSRCRACGKGFRLIGDSCEACEPSTFNSKNATLECESCPFPLTSPRQATSSSVCTTCPPGQVAFFGDCQPCTPGFFKPGRRGDCRRCPPGSVSGNGAVRCTPCPADTFARRFDQRCRPCPEGKTSNGPGATRCRPIGSASCPSTKFENANGDCQVCPSLFRYNKETKMCERCPRGTVSRGGLQTECEKCPPGQRPGDSPGACRCPQGMFRAGTKCEPCPPGTGGNFVNVIGRNGCIACGLGTFASRRGSRRCTPCPLGTFSDEEGAARCKRCPTGSAPNRTPRFILTIPGSTRCVSITTGCTLGSQPTRDAFGDLVCQRMDCLVGTPVEDIGIKCLPCRPGTRLVEERCRVCPIDAVSDGGVITECTQCNNGLFRSFFDDSKCACDGDPGTGKGIQDGVCKDCPPGSHGSPNFSECMECRKGFFASGFGNAFCTRCPTGTFSDEEGLASCKTCPKGQVPERLTGARECVPLARG